MSIIQRIYTAKCTSDDRVKPWRMLYTAGHFRDSCPSEPCNSSAHHKIFLELFINLIWLATRRDNKSNACDGVNKCWSVHLQIGWTILIKLRSAFALGLKYSIFDPANASSCDRCNVHWAAAAAAALWSRTDDSRTEWLIENCLSWSYKQQSYNAMYRLGLV